MNERHILLISTLEDSISSVKNSELFLPPTPSIQLLPCSQYQYGCGNRCVNCLESSKFGALCLVLDFNEMTALTS